ncbi:hypothetical protein SACE_6622 [Saccharopolyspora erythraea NRRL 2338]|uniref:Uncharacterized protein n=1 Tax=Saccharopolyspora erythraea (strain ATCC 11635 / DSM 40517 / JCM 4748 / NBRC 13426 / NCIMB 8594 / NRRL 2338) TaxID=405948 RepID=A4FP13_SACEN|nr:hypothetical protein N599_36560 [Saccharopolyspora erythraea D]CAM05788.1 hypothetical protein SACE_6622 [Saccharopolyspora erythraea NRRL 2338]
MPYVTVAILGVRPGDGGAVHDARRDLPHPRCQPGDVLRWVPDDA